MLDSEVLRVPQLGGSSIPIEQLPVSISKKTLGVWTNPAGYCGKQIKVIHDKIEEWANILAAGVLPENWDWVSYFHQLWVRVKYRLGCNASPVDDLKMQELKGNPLRKVFRKMLPHLGVNTNIKS